MNKFGEKFKNADCGQKNAPFGHLKEFSRKLKFAMFTHCLIPAIKKNFRKI